MTGEKTTGSNPDLHLALVHYPVVNKNGDIVPSAVTNLDLHDIARAARTYGVRSFSVVTPLEDQKDLVRRIVAHWTDGYGAVYNPKRGEALALIRLFGTLKEAIAAVTADSGCMPTTVATTARYCPGAISYTRCRHMIADGRPYMLIFGTAWGLAPAQIDTADFILEPIAGSGAYNHLSVRSAAAIALDRLAGITASGSSTAEYGPRGETQGRATS